MVEIAESITKAVYTGYLDGHVNAHPCPERHWVHSLIQQALRERTSGIGDAFVELRMIQLAALQVLAEKAGEEQRTKAHLLRYQGELTDEGDFSPMESDLDRKIAIAMDDLRSGLSALDREALELIPAAIKGIIVRMKERIEEEYGAEWLES